MTTIAQAWHLYLLECRDGSLYAGVTTSLARRFKAHASGAGAKYTRARPPVRFAATALFPCRASASRAEWQLKRQPREQKIDWLLRAGAAAAADLIDMPLEVWADRRLEVVALLAERGLYDGQLCHGTFSGTVASSGAQAPGIAHAWLVAPDGRIVDPTRWALDGTPPRIQLASSLCSAYAQQGSPSIQESR